MSAPEGLPLRRGDTGAAVRDLQQRLLAAGLLAPPVGVDVDGAPCLSQVCGGASHGRLGLHALVAAAPREQQDPGGHRHYLPARRR